MTQAADGARVDSKAGFDYFVPAGWERRGNELLRFCLRAISVLLLAAAFAAAVLDVAHTIADQTPTVTPMGVALEAMFPAKFEAWSQMLKSRAPWAWDPVALRVLYAPAFVDLGALGIVTGLLGRASKRREFRSAASG